MALLHNTPSAMADKVPVTVLTGFLGSGKTTLLNHILTAAHGKKIAVIENEFGEVGIDDALLAQNTKIQQEEGIIEMMNGCICCTVRQDLVEVLKKLAARVKEGDLKLDAIVIETTGMADPSPVAQTFFVDYAVKQFARLDGIVTLVDAMHIEQHLDDEKPEGAENEAVEQVAFADRLLLNKVDLVPEEADLARIEARLRSINSFAPIQRCQNSLVDVNNVLDIKGFDLERTLAMDPEFLDTDAEHVHDERVTSFGIKDVRPLSVDLMKEWITNRLLPNKGKEIYRMKGVISIDGSVQKFVYQAVHMINIGGFTEAWGPDEPRMSKLTFIGKDLDQKELQESFEACINTPENVAARLEILGMGSLRFAVGDQVSCIVSSRWTPGVVIKQGHWVGRSMCPYQVQLDDGTLIYAPQDNNTFIRLPGGQPTTSAQPVAPPAPLQSGWAQFFKPQSESAPTEKPAAVKCGDVQTGADDGDTRVPVTVLTGFLGSGKTTLLNHILTAPHGKKLAIIENEFGEVGIDDELLAKNTSMQSEEQIIEMMNGCICCTVRTDLIHVITKLAERSKAGEIKLDGIIIETTGMADPAPVAQTFFVNKLVESFARLDGIVTLIDAKHIEQHLDEEKPEGAENEAVEQVAFADRMLLNKTDLVTEDDLERVEKRLRAINGFAPIQRTVQSSVSVDSVLNIHGFDLKRTLEMDPEFLDTDAEHEHDATVTSLSIVQPGEVDFELIQDWVHVLLQTKGVQMYRMKGVLAVANRRQKLVFQAVHMIFKWSDESVWGADEPRVSKLVFIGKDLDHAELKAGFSDCVISPEVMQKKEEKRGAARQICSWAQEALPAAFASKSVTVDETRVAKPACPIETVLRVTLATPKLFTLPKPLTDVSHDDVIAVMQGWEELLQRAQVVQEWAQQALPPTLAGQPVMIDEIETPHVNVSDRFETVIHVLGSPPCSMKVLRRLEDVTQKSVQDVMALAALCGSCGVPTVR